MGASPNAKSCPRERLAPSRICYSNDGAGNHAKDTNEIDKLVSFPALRDPAFDIHKNERTCY